MIKALPGNDGAFWLLDGPEAPSAGSDESLVVLEPFAGLPEAFSTWKGSTELGLSLRHQFRNLFAELPFSFKTYERGGWFGDTCTRANP